MLGRLATRRPRPGSTRAIAAYRSSAAASSSVLPDALDRSSDAYARNIAAVGGLLSDLCSRVSQVLGGGGAGAVKRNEGRGKLLPRDCIDRLLGPRASFLELSQIEIIEQNYYCFVPCPVHDSNFVGLQKAL
ncbi:hypothetical protein D1007_07448 [Hordeum vulgare]|nr:hypothetical protein D1007_07448 [Hordeum vulgare]